MGRAVAFLADALALARLALELRAAWRENARLGAPTEPLGAPDVGGSAETGPPDPAGGVGPTGEAAGSGAREGAGPLGGPATLG